MKPSGRRLAQETLSWVSEIQTWARSELVPAERLSVASEEAAQFGVGFAYGGEFLWGWDNNSWRIPLLDADWVNQFLMGPNVRARVELSLMLHANVTHVLDLIGDPASLILAGASCVVDLWIVVPSNVSTAWERLVSDNQLSDRVHVSSIGQGQTVCPGFRPEWVRCGTVEDWRKMQAVDPEWRRLKPVLSTTPSGQLTAGYGSAIHNYDGDGQRLRETTIDNATLCVIVPNGSAQAARLDGLWDETGLNNETFWESRYVANPERGSGIGSRGTFRDRKGACMQSIVSELSPGSILDVGCGDRTIWDEVLLPDNCHYVGVDISHHLVAKLRQRWPELTFLDGDFIRLSADKQFPSDLVVCLDVLIHQHDYREYRRLVEALWRSTRKTLIVAGYEKAPGGGDASAITAWHEPLSSTMSSVGVAPAKVLMEYRGTTVFRVDRLLDHDGAGR